MKFNDADLIGVPLRLTVSSRNHAAGVVEMKIRDGGEASQVARAEAVAAAVAARRALIDGLTVAVAESAARQFGSAQG